MIENQAPDPNCTVKVDGGRGFIIEQRVSLPHESELESHATKRLVVTAAHCLPKIPPAFAMSDTEERTYENLLGSLFGESNVWAECLFVDPVADIAVLGEPDGQQLGHAREAAYYDLVENLAVVPIGNAKSGAGKMLTLDGHWKRITIEVISCIWGASLQIDPTDGGQSGSPILDDEGAAIGVVVIGTEIEQRNERCGPQPILRRALPGWLL